jgi:hypothetical protein
MIRKLKILIARLRYEGWATEIVFVFGFFMSVIVLSIHIIGCILDPWLLLLLPLWYFYIVPLFFVLKDGITLETLHRENNLLEDYEEQRIYIDNLNKIIRNQKKLLQSKTKTI